MNFDQYKDMNLLQSLFLFTRNYQLPNLELHKIAQPW